MQEATASWNGYFKSKEGNKDQFTLRKEDGQSDKEFLTRIREFNKQAAAQGWTPWGSNAPDQGAPSESKGGEKSFEVASIKLADGGDNPRWVIKGGNFTKFGVTCWMETLEAAGIATKLDPLKENKPKGDWVAYYIERVNDEGKTIPDKVTRLVRTK